MNTETVVAERELADRALREGEQRYKRLLTEHKIAAQELQQAYAKLRNRESSLKQLVRRLRASHRDLQEAQRHLIEAARLESVGTLAAGVAHEVKNPLQTILLGLDFLRPRIPTGDAAIAEVLADMREAVIRASSIIRELLLMTSDSEFKPQPDDLNQILEHSLRLLNTSLVANQTEIVLQLAPDLPPVLVDGTKLQQVFINLMLNAVQAMEQHGKLTVSTRCFKLTSNRRAGYRHFKTGDCLVSAEVQDTGPGIPEKILPRIFDPFFTTKPIGVGTGLGLSVAKKIVDLHHGQIQIKNQPTGGVVAAVTLKA